jgi:hypothetical protein
MKAGYFEDNKFIESNVGVLQGDVTSLNLNNIYLHELDVFMNNLYHDFRKGKHVGSHLLTGGSSILLVRRPTLIQLRSYEGCSGR